MSPARSADSCASTWKARRYTDATMRIFEQRSPSFRQAGRDRDPGVSAPRRGRCPARDRARRAGTAGQGRLRRAGSGRVPGRGSKSTRTSPASRSCCWSEGTYPAIATHDPDLDPHHARSSPARCQVAARSASSSRCSMASAATSRTTLVTRRLPDARVRALRHRVVSVLHPPHRRAARQCALRAPPASRLIGGHRRQPPCVHLPGVAWCIPAGAPFQSAATIASSSLSALLSSEGYNVLASRKRLTISSGDTPPSSRPMM